MHSDTNYIRFKDNKIQLRLDVIFRKEGNAYVSFAPALNLSGCGNTEEEAKASFEIVVKEYLRYTIANNTLEEDLIRHNWVKEKIHEKDVYKSPSLWMMIVSNPELQKALEGKITKQPETFTVFADGKA